MKNNLGLFLVVPVLLAACSSEGSKFGSGSNGGATSVGGANGAGGTSAIVNATEVPVKDWTDTAGGAGTGDNGDGPFGNLLDNPYGDPNDPCTLAAIWISGVTLSIENGDLVQYEGKVYKYDTTASSCNKSITYTFDACIPSAPAEWCKPCWILQENITCPIIDITVIPDTTGDAGVDIVKDAG